MKAADTGPRPPGDESVARASIPDIPDRSLPDLVRELAGDGADLVRQELALGKAEFREKLDHYADSLVTMAIGSALLLAGLMTFLWGVNAGLTALVAEFVGLEVAVWLTPMVLAALFGVLGLGMVKGARKSMREEGVVPHQTARSLRTTKVWAENTIRDVKEEATHV